MSEGMRQRQMKYAILVVVGLVQWIYAAPVLTFEINEKWNLQTDGEGYELNNELITNSRAPIFDHLQESVNSNSSFHETKGEINHLADATGFIQDSQERMTSFDPFGTTLSPKCTNTSSYSRRGCWLAAEGRSDCWVWNPSPQSDESVSWDGHCVDGLLSGQGTVIWRFFQDGREIMSWQAGHYREGREHGHFVYKNSSGKIWEGHYESGEPHGLWVVRGTDQDLELIANCRQFGREVDLNTCIQETNVPIVQNLKSTVALRFGPGTEFGSTGKLLTTGTRVEVTHTNTGWVWVKTTNGHAGFVPKVLLTEITSDVSDTTIDTRYENMSEEEIKLWILRNLLESL